MRRLVRLVAGLAMASALTGSSLAAGPVEASASRYNVMAGGYYVREAKDQEWHVKLVGAIPSLCGAYLVIIDAAGKPVYQGAVPHGKYPVEKPYLITVKPDGVTGDYRMIMLGHQDDMLGVLAPWTDLPLEVYGGGSMSVGHNPAARVWFKAPEGVTKMGLGAHAGHLQVLDAAGKVVADTKVIGKKEKYANVMEFAVTPGATYELKREAFYFNSTIPDTFFFAVEPQRWFKPAKELDEVKWWQNVK